MRKFCLIGHPLGHSLSPQIHSRLFELSGEEAEYTLVDIPRKQLAKKFWKLAEYEGFNITIPNKVEIIDYCDELSHEARRYNSVNCVKNGATKVGYNTDCIGFSKSIEMLGSSLTGKVLVIGCGGVGRMAAIETVVQGGELTVAVLPSDLDNAIQVMKRIHELFPESVSHVVVIDKDVLLARDLKGEKFDLLVNCTPVGMFPNVDYMPCEPDVLDNVDAVFDLVYNPRETLLTKTAREKGRKALNGMAMLVLQAVAAHEIWDGATYKKEDIDKLISDMEELV